MHNIGSTAVQESNLLQISTAVKTELHKVVAHLVPVDCFCCTRLQFADTPADEADAPLRYAARAQGDCVDVVFPRQPKTTQNAIGKA